MVTVGILPSGKIPTVGPGIEPGTSWLVVRDHEAGQFLQMYQTNDWSEIIFVVRLIITQRIFWEKLQEMNKRMSRKVDRFMTESIQRTNS